MRLYLSKKDDQSLFIENCKIPQHHLDGVRFIYRQYKKKKPGVIIYDTTAFSKNLQIVLFIKAMCRIFEQPVLVLCQEGAEHSWMEQFQTWTDLCDDIALETQKPHIKKQVLINTMANLPAFCNRNWSVLVIDVPEVDKASLQLLQLPFKADYKIWITSINLRENLDLFSKLYKWLYPKEEFDKNDFIPDRHNLNDVVDKAILLDAFMEDIVSRNEDVQSAIEDKEVDKTPPRRISLKNKDATGTKIKRTKRKTSDDSDKIINTLVKDQEFDDDFSIDNFKRKRKEFDENVPSDKEESNTGIKSDTINSQSQVNLYYEPDSSTDINSDRLYEMDTLVFGNDTCDEQGVNVNENVNEIIETNEENYLGHENNANETNLGIEDETPSDTDLDIQEEGKIYISNNDNMSMKSPSTRKHSDNNELNRESDSDNNEINRDGEDGICMKSSLSFDELKPKNNELETQKDSKFICEEIKSCNNTESQEIDELKSNKDYNSKIFKSDELQIESNCNEVNDERSPVTDKLAAPVNALKHKCIEDNLKDLEEKVMKRFKGTILDSLI